MSVHNDPRSKVRTLTKPEGLSYGTFLVPDTQFVGHMLCVSNIYCWYTKNSKIVKT